jgi:ABC-type branched-subunit amino acid transport system ATPase component
MRSSDESRSRRGCVAPPACVAVRDPAFSGGRKVMRRSMAETAQRETDHASFAQECLAWHGIRIARALMMQPKLLVLDEPTLGLAPVILEQLSKALVTLRQTTDITVLSGGQNVTFVLPHADRIYVIEHSQIVWEGDPARFTEEAGAGYL